MSKRRHSIVGLAAAAVLATVLVAASAKPARAGCSFDDLAASLGNFFTGTYSLLKDPGCAPHLGNPVFWVLAGAASVTAMHSPALVGQACAEVEDWKSKLSSGATDAQDYKKKAEDWLKKLGVSDADLGATGKAIGDMLDAAGDIAGVMNLFGCACSMSQAGGLGQATQVVNDCIVGALCWLDELVFGNSCDNADKPTELVDCTNRYTQIYDRGAFYCDANGFCISDHITNDAAAYSGMACFCPKPMEMVRTQADLCRTAPDKWAGGGYDCYQCRCPQGSKPAGNTEMLRRICVCDGGQLVGADGKCAPPPPKTACGCSCPSTQVVTKIVERPDGQCDCSCGCKPGQELIDETCVPACSDPTKVLLANATCCERSQVAACGTCCPAGMKPDAASGSCVSHLVAAPPSQPPQQPKKKR